MFAINKGGKDLEVIIKIKNFKHLLEIRGWRGLIMINKSVIFFLKSVIFNLLF